MILTPLVFPGYILHLAAKGCHGLENVSAFELQSIRIIDCNIAIWLIESKHLKMTKVIKLSKID